MARPKKQRRPDVDEEMPRIRTVPTRGHVFDQHKLDEFLRPLKRWAQRSVAGHSRSVDG